MKSKPLNEDQIDHALTLISGVHNDDTKLDHHYTLK